MAEPTSVNFPTSLDTTSTLGNDLKNLLSWTLSGALTDVATTITATSNIVSITEPFYIRIDNEVIWVTGISGSQFTGCTRGCDGTTNVVHSDGATIYHILNANIINQHRRAILAIENQMGTDRRIFGLVSNPQAVYAQRAQITMMRTPTAITITRIHIYGSDTTPTSELAGDLKFADDINIGGFANATIIDVCDTTSGVKTITTGFDDATVPAGKYIYFQMDASPHTDWKDFYIEVYYTVD